MKRGILLINIGTPETPTKKAVSSYLKEFLNDPYVIVMPKVLRYLLVNGIIIPFRAGKSTKRYQQLWTKEGSPLLVHLRSLQTKLQTIFNDEYTVFGAMSYGKPQLSEVLREIEKHNFDELIVVPLYPHYTTSTTLSAIEGVKKHTAHWKNTTITNIKSFYQEEPFIEALSKRISSYRIEDYDHLLFSYHSLPLKQVKSSCEGDDSTECYEKACYGTTELLAKALNLQTSDYSTAFQSNISDRWLAPYTKDILKELAQKGKKKVLVITPSFVADCLETTVEIGQEYRDDFIKMGGSELRLVECLNDAPYWVEALAKIIRHKTH